MTLFSIRCSPFASVVFFLVLLLVGCISATEEFQDCYEKVTLADGNRDALLDMNDFLNLLKLYNNTYIGIVTSLSPTQLDFFMKTSKCSCMSDPFNDKTCCTPEDSNIQLPTGDISIFEQVGLTLLCEQALVLSSHMEVEDVVPTYSPMPSWLSSNLPTIIPTQRVVNKEITPAPTQPINPQPTDFPSQAVSVDEPTPDPSNIDDFTNPPTPLPVIIKEIPVAVPIPPIASPPDIRPTLLPSLAVAEDPTQTPIYVPVLPPLDTTEDAWCINSMILSDANGDKLLTYDEYIEFVRRFIRCNSIQSDDSLILESFAAAKCIRNLVTCYLTQTMDISVFYIPSDVRSVPDKGDIQVVCQLAEVLAKQYPDCVNFPTPEPAQIPTVQTNPPIVAPIPVDEPTIIKEITTSPTIPVNIPQVTNLPTSTPVTAPSIPIDGPAIVTLSPEIAQVPSPPVDCILRLLQADGDDDSLLTQEEFLDYIKLQPGCDSITSLSSQQSQIFTDLAALCVREPGADPELCVQPRNARVSIDGSDNKERTDAQKTALSNVCAATENACTIIDAPAPVAILPPVDAQTQLPIEEPPSVVTPDAPTPTIDAPNQIQPIVPSDGSPINPAGTDTPSSSNVDTPTFPTGSAPAPLESPNGEPAAPASNSASPNGEPATAPTSNSASPPLGVVDVPSEECINATLQSDTDQNKYLFQDEYLSFIQIYSKCDLIDMLSAQHRAVFQNLACSCLNDPNASPDCCLPGNAKIFIGDTQKLSYKTYSLSEICFLTAATFDDECVAPPTTAPIEYPDLDQCSYDLVASDEDNNTLLDKQEYLSFIRKFGQCEAIQTLDLGHNSVFHTMACECVNQGRSFECCLPGNATLNISGASLQDSNRTQDQISMLSKICITASGLTNRECIATATEVPTVDCADSLVAADKDDNQYLDMGEYLYFFQETYSNCSGIEWLSLSQRVVFSLMACSCLLEPDAELECCFSGKALINIAAAQLRDTDRTTEQKQFLSTLCTASNAAADIGCRTALPTPAPTRNFTLELSSPPSVVTKTSVTAVASPDDRPVPSASQARVLSMQSAGLLCIVALLLRVLITE